MSIVLRVNKGSALTYAEMDTNLSSFIYSSSLNSSGTQIQLHYSGSSALGGNYAPRIETIPFPLTNITIPEAVAAGADQEVQFNKQGAFGADNLFRFDYNKNVLGIGTSTLANMSTTIGGNAKLVIHSEDSREASIALTRFSSHNVKAGIKFLQDNVLIADMGLLAQNQEDRDTYITNRHFIPGTVGTTKEGAAIVGRIHMSITGPVQGVPEQSKVATFKIDVNNSPLLGIGTENPNRQLSTAGDLGIGISPTGNTGLASFLTPIPAGINQATNSTGTKSLVPPTSHTDGLLISSPSINEGGNIVVNINTDSAEKEVFNVITSRMNDYSATTAKVVASFPAGGQIGFNKQDSNLFGITVEGSISGSGGLYINDVPQETATFPSTPVGVDSQGRLRESLGGVTPIGGIIMWSGAISSIPDGWRLCDGGTGLGQVSDITVPDLRNKFIVGATADDSDTTYPSLQPGSTLSNAAADAVVVSHNHEGATVTGGSHTHVYKDTIFSEESGGAGGTGYIDNIDLVHSGEGNRQNNTDENGQNVHSYSINRNTNTPTQGTHTHSINSDGVNGTNKNLPPYYALAYIIFVGY
tara:strand:+ start:193 stop:1944 length:1752 start_codon:yes stop_codon:yes gene_type:complete